MKTCTRCGKLKPLSEFHVNRSTSTAVCRDGRRPDCKSCRRSFERWRWRYANHKTVLCFRDWLKQELAHV